MREKLRRLFCGLRGHDALLHFEAGRMSLQCMSCGFETPGWDLRGAPTAAATDAPKFIRLPLFGERRVA